jgi:hypothetical protein
MVGSSPDGVDLGGAARIGDPADQNNGLNRKLE